MSDLFISSQLRPQVGVSRSCPTGRPAIRPLPDCSEGPEDRVIKCREKGKEKSCEKLFAEKHSDKRCGEKIGDIKRHNEKFGDKPCGEKLSDIKQHNEKLGDKGCGEKLGDIKRRSEKLGDKGCGEKLGDKRYQEKLDDIKRHHEKCGEKRSHEKGCFEKCVEICHRDPHELHRIVPSERFFVK